MWEEKEERTELNKSKRKLPQKSQRKRMEITMKLEITESEKEKKISGTLGACFSLLSFPPHLTHTTPPTLAKG